MLCKGLDKMTDNFRYSIDWLFNRLITHSFVQKYYIIAQKYEICNKEISISVVGHLNQ